VAINYSCLLHSPKLFLAMTGLDSAQFNNLLRDIQVPFSAAERKRLTRRERKRHIGAGHPFALQPTDQTLLTLIWLRLHPNYEALSLLFGVSDTTAARCVRRVLPLLAASGHDLTRSPDPGSRQRLTFKELLHDLPELKPLMVAV
jgi:hypothetical protein